MSEETVKSSAEKVGVKSKGDMKMVIIAAAVVVVLVVVALVMFFVLGGKKEKFENDFFSAEYSSEWTVEKDGDDVTFSSPDAVKLNEEGNDFEPEDIKDFDAAGVIFQVKDSSGEEYAKLIEDGDCDAFSEAEGALNDMGYGASDTKVKADKVGDTKACRLTTNLEMEGVKISTDSYFLTKGDKTINIISVSTGKGESAVDEAKDIIDSIELK